MGKIDEVIELLKNRTMETMVSHGHSISHIEVGVGAYYEILNDTAFLPYKSDLTGGTNKIMGIPLEVNYNLEANEIKIV